MSSVEELTKKLEAMEKRTQEQEASMEAFRKEQDKLYQKQVDVLHQKVAQLSDINARLLHESQLQLDDDNGQNINIDASEKGGDENEEEMESEKFGQEDNKDHIPCSNCGGTMVINGANCYKCPGCFNDTGCG